MAKPIYPKFGAMIRKRRNGLRLKKEELAEQAGISKQGLWLIESGRSNPSLFAVIALCQVLRLDPKVSELIK